MAVKEKVHITIDKELIPLIDDMCKKEDRTRSSLINNILNKFFDRK